MDLTLEEKLAATVKQLNLADKRIQELIDQNRLLNDKCNDLYTTLELIYYAAKFKLDNKTEE